MEKQYRYYPQVGTSKHCVFYFDGIKKHQDGSPFFDLVILKNLKNLKKFIKLLAADGYIES
jgi:hypothetical protein